MIFNRFLRQSTLSLCSWHIGMKSLDQRQWLFPDLCRAFKLDWCCDATRFQLMNVSRKFYEYRPLEISGNVNLILFHPPMTNPFRSHTEYHTSITRHHIVNVSVMYAVGYTVYSWCYGVLHAILYAALFLISKLQKLCWQKKDALRWWALLYCFITQKSFQI